ncbi:MAG: DUF2911 domain-containing protein [Acidobacteriota bacterium]
MVSNRSIRLLIVLLALACIALPTIAERADDADRASKNGKITGTIDGVEVTVEYGRPNVKGRTIWGDLVPYGQVWRTGADEATTITFSKDVSIEGKALKAGTYALFTVPGKKEWNFIFNKEAKQWGAYKRDAKQDMLSVNVAPHSVDHVESMTFAIDGSKVMLHWDKLAVGFSVAAHS